MQSRPPRHAKWVSPLFQWNDDSPMTTELYKGYESTRVNFTRNYREWRTCAKRGGAVFRGRIRWVIREVRLNFLSPLTANRPSSTTKAYERCWDVGKGSWTTTTTIIAWSIRQYFHRTRWSKVSLKNHTERSDRPDITSRFKRRNGLITHYPVKHKIICRTFFLSS